VRSIGARSKQSREESLTGVGIPAAELPRVVDRASPLPRTTVRMPRVASLCSRHCVAPSLTRIRAPGHRVNASPALRRRRTREDAAWPAIGDGDRPAPSVARWTTQIRSKIPFVFLNVDRRSEIERPRTHPRYSAESLFK
jgi:hypothetical protein